MLMTFSGPDAPVSVYALHPGVVHTDFFRNFPQYQQWIIAVGAWLVNKDCWHGAQTTIYCAVDESIETETGKYYRFVTSFTFVFMSV